MPLAVQWGGQVFLDGQAQSSSYALATLLSTVCNALNVTLVRDWNIGLPEYWGAVGHYSIASEATGKISHRKLKQLMTANLDRISFNLADIDKKNMAGLSKRDFVPLADVPDMVWKVGPHKRGGMNSPEHANHFADMDRELPAPLPEGATLDRALGVFDQLCFHIGLLPAKSRRFRNGAAGSAIVRRHHGIIGG